MDVRLSRGLRCRWWNVGLELTAIKVAPFSKFGCTKEGNMSLSCLNMFRMRYLIWYADEPCVSKWVYSEIEDSTDGSKGNFYVAVILKPWNWYKIIIRPGMESFATPGPIFPHVVFGGSFDVFFILLFWWWPCDPSCSFLYGWIGRQLLNYFHCIP